ncbi:MAG TPA: hypothetical protein VK436_11915 [Methanocella sp.]|nr:hypothetical protein [Methanocella sp.]
MTIAAKITLGKATPATVFSRHKPDRKRTGVHPDRRTGRKSIAFLKTAQEDLR